MAQMVAAVPGLRKRTCAGVLQTFPNEVTIAYTWRVLNRMTSRTSAGVSETYTHDEGSHGKGRLSRLNDATGQTLYTYSSGGELIQQVSTVLGAVFQTNWNYDAAGRLTVMSYPTGLSLSYSYDGYGRVNGVYSNLGGTWSTLIDSILYQPATDIPYAWRFGNNQPRLITLNNDGKVSQLYTAGAQNVGFGYSNVDNINHRQDYLYANLSANYTYDPVDRLNGVGSASDPQGFAYDASGNRVAQVRRGAGYGYSVDPASNRLIAFSMPGLTRSFGYDAAGNLISESRSDGSRTYGYDAFDRMNGVAFNGSWGGD